MDLRTVPVAASVRAIGRAGAGVNNVPVDDLSRRGVAVFNTPGANANAVKELVLAGLLLAARRICPAWDFARSLSGDDGNIDAGVEKGKHQFVGFELPGRTLGVVGLGAVGGEVANSALALGMKVLGYDPLITIRRAWQLSSSVEQALSLDDLFARSDAISVHVPLTDETRGLVNAHRLKLLKRKAVVLNFARAAIVEERSITEALDAGHLGAYICDFPTAALKDQPGVVTLPHLGASTVEAEENCAVMVVDQIRDYLENGNIRNSVNYPDANLPRVPNTTRLSILNLNVPNMVGQISTSLATQGVNIADLLNKSRGDYAYTLVDADGTLGEETVQKIRTIDGVLRARLIQ
jgi:D-3-phosphoglycerate dehydrogenase / 2-oxoglutarate reductase